MIRLALIAATCGLLLGLSVTGDEPPKKLTAEERKELETRWTELMLAGRKAFQDGKLPEATKAFQGALEIARKAYPKSEFPDGHPYLAPTLNNLAFVYQAQGKLAEAEPLSREALEMTRRLFKGDHANVVASLNNLAQLYQAQGKLAEAETLYKEVLDIRKRLFKGDHLDVARSLHELASVHNAQGKLTEAEPLFRESLEMHRRLLKGDNPTVATSLNNLAHVLKGQSKLADAEPLFRDALDMRKRLFKGDHPDLATSLNNLALLLEAQGKLTDAEPLSREALEMRRRLFKGDHSDVAASLNNRGLLLQALGKLTEAESLSRDAFEMNKRLFKGDHPDLARSLNNRAFLLDAQGKRAEAESLYREALNMDKRWFKADHPSVAGSMNNLAGLLVDRGEAAAAEPLYREALEMHKRFIKGDHASVASSLNNLAGVLQLQAKFTEAEPLLRDALEMSKRITKGDHPDVALGMNNLALLLQARGKLADAEPLLRDALAMRKRLFRDDHLDIAITLNNLAGVLHSQNRLAEAGPTFREALAMSRRLLESYTQQKAEGEALTFQTSVPATLSGFLSVARDAKLEAAAVYAETWADKAAVARIYEARQQAARAVTDPKTAKLVAELAELRRRRADLLLAPSSRDPATLKKRQQDLKELDDRLSTLGGAIRPLLPAVERAERLGKSSPGDLQKALSPDTVVVDFLRYVHFEFNKDKPGAEGQSNTARYLAFVITKQQASWIDLGEAATIATAVNAWREAITSGKEIPAAIPAKVRELVWEKVRKELPANIKTVYIAPDVVLCRVPWAALPGDKPGTILLEDYAIATVPHAPFLLDKLWAQEALKNPPSGALVVGGVNYDAEAIVGPANRDLPVKPGAKVTWPSLPGAAAEATGVANAAERKKLLVTALKTETATPAAVLAALPKAKYAHFATHGFFADPSFRSAFQLDKRDFERSLRGERIGRAAVSPLVMTGIVFAGANNPKTPGRGIVTGESLIDLNLSGLELAVLSACETGLGDVAGGEGTFGLQRAFHLAGTRDVVASLWKVPDAPTGALMAEFYSNLWVKNQPPMESLRQAQLTIYRNPGKIAELAAGFRAGFKEVPGGEIDIKPTADGKTPTRLWAAFMLSGPGQ